MQIHELPWARMAAEKWANHHLGKTLNRAVRSDDQEMKILTDAFLAGLAEGRPVTVVDAQDWARSYKRSKIYLDLKRWYPELVEGFIAGNAMFWKVSLEEG